MTNHCVTTFMCHPLRMTLINVINFTIILRMTKFFTGIMSMAQVCAMHKLVVEAKIWIFLRNFFNIYYNQNRVLLTL